MIGYDDDDSKFSKPYTIIKVFEVSSGDNIKCKANNTFFRTELEMKRIIY